MNTRRILSLALLTGALALGATSCADDAERTDNTTAATTTGAQVVGPVMADITSIDGTTVEVALGRVLVISAEQPAAWSATIADASIVGFQAGTVDGDASFNPGFTPLAVGSTQVTMTDGTTTVTFTIAVTA